MSDQVLYSDPHMGPTEKYMWVDKMYNLLLLKKLFNKGYDISNIDFAPKQEGTDYFNNKPFFINLLTNLIGNATLNVCEDDEGYSCDGYHLVIDNKWVKHYLQLIASLPESLKIKRHYVNKVKKLLAEKAEQLSEFVINEEGLLCCYWGEDFSSDYEMDTLFLLKLINNFEKYCKALEKEVTS